MSTEAGKFVQSSYDDNNDIALQIFENYSKVKGYRFKRKVYEDYLADGSMEHPATGERVPVELEMRAVEFTDEGVLYNGRIFPDLSFLGRKLRLVEKEGEFLYVIISKDTDMAAVAWSSTIYKDKYRVVKNINTDHRRGNDVMYHVPLNDLSIIKIR